MADPNPNAQAEQEAHDFAAEQDRLLLLSHADDRPAVSIAALAPRNRPVDAETRVVTAPEARSADDFKDPASGLEPEVSDVSTARREVGSEAGDKAAEDAKGKDTPSETVPAEVTDPPAAERQTADGAKPVGSGPKGKASKS